MKKLTDTELKKIYNSDKIVVIEYPLDVGGHFKDRLWMATIKNEVEDYNSKDNLIQMAKEMKKDWIVLRRHRGGGKSIIEKNKEKEDIVKEMV